jgi:hypothetical protein
MGSNVDHQKRQCLEGGYPYTTCRADADGNITLPAPETEIFQETRYAKHWHIAKLKHLSRYLARTGHGDVCTQSKNGKWYYLWKKKGGTQPGFSPRVFLLLSFLCPRQDSNPEQRFRRPM